MKKLRTPTLKLTLLGLSLLILNACSGLANNPKQSLNSSSTSADDSLTRSGEISAQALISDYPKFAQSYQAFTPVDNDVENFKLLKGLDVVVFLGLWCHDSQREVPRLLKLVEQSDYPLKSLKLITINVKKAVPADYSEQFEVSRTPTILVLKNGQIIAKIVEKPAASITQDLLSQIFH